MKKTLLAIAGFFIIVSTASAQTACTIDTTAVPAGKFSSPDTLPCAEKTVLYDQVVQIKIPSQIDLKDLGLPISFILYIDSIVVTGVNGLPDSIKASYNPANGIFYGGKNYCFRVTGTAPSTVLVGNYVAEVQGTLTAHGNPYPGFFDGDTTISLQDLADQGFSPLNLSLDVINKGAKCRSKNTGIFETSFNAIIKTYPNPATNVLNIDVNSVDRINGDLLIFDELGRKVLSEKVDWIGYQNKQINVAEFSKGIYVLQLTDGKTKYSSKFSVE